MPVLVDFAPCFAVGRFGVFCVVLPFGGLLLWLSRYPPFASLMLPPSGPLCHRLNGLYRQVDDDFWAGGLCADEYRVSHQI